MTWFGYLAWEKIWLLPLLLLLLLAAPDAARAQGDASGQMYTDARGGYQLGYPTGWQVMPGENHRTTFYVGPDWETTPATATISLHPLPDDRKALNLLQAGQLDSVWRYLTAGRPRARVYRLEERDEDRFQELRYDYAYDDDAPRPTGGRRTRVLGRRLWREGYEYRLEYRGPDGPDPHRAAAQLLLASLRLVSPGPSSRRPPPPPLQGCDDKFYGIAALRINNDIWEDDCRTIHEFSSLDPAQPPVIHRRVLPFQSYALAKGFDNCLYAVTKAPTNAPEYVYRYNPATRRGEYTGWQLPAQGSGGVWISGGTDDRGDLYFSTSDGNLLVRVNPASSKVSTVWSTDPLRRASYFGALGFAGAGTHANFCFDARRTLYQVYSTDGSLLRINIDSRQPAPDIQPLDGLPERGGYSGILLQNDEFGNRRLFLAGPKAIYQVDLETKVVARIRRGVYTDLAGCNLFRKAASDEEPAPALVRAPWRGRVLDAVTLQPLPRAGLRLRPVTVSARADTALTLTAGGAFVFPARPGNLYAAQLRLPGYVPLDTTFAAAAGPYAQDVLLRPLGVGATLELENVQFSRGQGELLATSFPALDTLATLLTGSPGLTIELRGHTDNVGDPQKNVELSQRRVAAVKTYLVKRGVAPERISGVGLGGAEPRASNAQENTRRLNRRVEFRVTGVQ
ncbi:OmpA family protein [Hymenobacter psychrophilus]|uniref:Outer membrane protein OmpA n=1 Tax=Hymenobacter psychrophilus TaxID=651662 RepID=A0A1H3BT50_9BACT|nr:OmpA family protein [Hymenobacter psychrophilus]SDX45077.1 Outer membrane protein OmpA [Hymenobacter psychrophilus]